MACASTSRPLQELGPTLANLAREASEYLLYEFQADEGGRLLDEFTKLLTPAMKEAYLVAHFIHLEMVKHDYEVFLGTSIGGWLNSLQEENAWGLKMDKVGDVRVSGHWSLGLRKRRYDGEGAERRRVWDILVRAKVTFEPPRK